jgi:pyruvate kinase
VINNIKIICTLGPSSYKKKTLKLLKKENVDIFRINLSHTKISDIKKKIIYLKKNKINNICIDTEGAQIRTTLTDKKYYLKKGSEVKIFNNEKNSTKNSISFYPSFQLEKIKAGVIIDIGFNNLSLKVMKYKSFQNCLICIVTKGGYLESKKGVHVNAKLTLPSLTQKDIFALKLAKEMNIKFFALSFVNDKKDVELVKTILGKKTFIISKIETKNALINIEKIIRCSSALLIDRGDLSRYVPIEKIPIAQNYIVQKAKKLKKPTYVATNLLETMIKENLPTRAESHDIYSTLKQGVKGLVLAAETAIGISPVDCVKFLKKCIKVNNSRKIFND